MTKQLTSRELAAFRVALLAEQGNVSALTGLPIAPGAACLDHCHVSGHCRGVISRAENSVLGKLEKGKRYGKDFDVLAFAKGVHAYLSKEKTLPLHPTFGKKTRRRRHK